MWSPAAEEVEDLVLRDDSRVAYITQTTLSVQDTRDVIAALTRRFPEIVGPDTRNICYATQNRQAAVQAMAPHCDLILVIGSRSSSNSSRLREVGAQCGVESHLIEGPDAIDERWFDGGRHRRLQRRRLGARAAGAGDHRPSPQLPHGDDPRARGPG